MTQPKSTAKFYKNPARNNQPTYKPYVPHYQLEGIEPTKYNSGAIPANTPIARPEPLPMDNPRASRPLIRQPYAEAVASPLGRGTAPPNVGNNVEQSWSSVDGHLIDDLSNETLDPTHPMIDNNEFMTDTALGGFKSGIDARSVPTNLASGQVKIEQEPTSQTTDNSELFSIISNLEEDTFLLMAGGTPLCSGPKEEIEELAQSLIFGEHELCDNQPIPQEDIIILKKVKIKIGLFLE